MGIATGLTAERMLAIEAQSVVGGFVDVNGNLILKRHDNVEIDAGRVKGDNATALLNVSDNDSVDFTLAGAGTPSDPWLLSALAKGLAPQEVADWNSITKPGLYWSNSALNGPSASGWYIGTVSVHVGGSRIVQEVRESRQTNFQNVLTRYWNGTAWTEWRLSGGTGRGGTAERNILFPTPTTDAQRVALANQRIIWFNSDLGWEESYYMTAGASGLTAPGLFSHANIPPGWYPTGPGPMAVLYGNGTQAFSAAGNYTNWRHFGTTLPSDTSVDSWRNTTGNASDGSSIFYRASGGASLQTFLAGRYRLSAGIQVPAGTGTGVISLRGVPNLGGGERPQSSGIPLISGYGQQRYYELANLVLGSSGYMYLRSDAGSWSIGSLYDTWMSLQYLGPALALR